MKYVLPFTFILRQSHTFMTLVLGSILVLVPIYGQIVLTGWTVRLHQALMADDDGDKKVPPIRLEDLSTDFRLGLGPFVMQLIMGVIMGVMLTPLVLAPGVIGSLAIPTLAASDLTENQLAAIFVAGVLFFSILILVGLYTMVMATHAAMIKAELSHDVKGALTGLSPKWILSFFKTTPRELLKASIGLGFGSSVVIVAGLLAFTAGFYPAVVITFAAGGHLRAQIYKIYLERRAEPSGA